MRPGRSRCAPDPRSGLDWGVRVLLGAALLCAGAADAVVDRDCALAPAACTLGEAASQAGVWFGAAVGLPGEAERRVVPAHYNALTTENALKWGPLAARVGEYDFATADAIVAFAAETGARLRGHALLWGRGPLPADLSARVAAAPDPAAELRALVGAHIATVVARYRGRIPLWDVVNEPLEINGAALDPNLFARTLDEDYIAEAFQLARAADPEALLFLNEFFLDYEGAKADAFLALLRRLLDAGVPIDGVGVQAHFDGFLPIPLPTREAFQGLLEAIAAEGVLVEVTELDVSLRNFPGDPDPLARQAGFYAMVAEACLVVPACTGITTWGIDDSRTWLDRFAPFHLIAPHEPLLLDAALEPKPAYFAVRDALAAHAVAFPVRAAGLVELVEAAVAEETLEGVGHGRSAVRRLRQLTRDLGRVVRLIERARYADACRRLGRVARRLDGRRPTRDWAAGPAVPTVLDALGALREALGCR